MSRNFLTAAIHYGTIFCVAVLVHKHLQQTDQGNVNSTRRTMTTTTASFQLLLRYAPYVLTMMGLVVGSDPIAQVGILWLSIIVAYSEEAGNNNMLAKYYMPSKVCTDENIQNAVETLGVQDPSGGASEEEVAQVLSDIAKWAIMSSSVQQQQTANDSVLCNSGLTPRIIVCAMKLWETSQVVRRNGCWALACLISSGNTMICLKNDEVVDDYCSNKAACDTQERSQSLLTGDRLVITSTDTETEMELEIPVPSLSNNESDQSTGSRLLIRPKGEGSRYNTTVIISDRVAMWRLQDALNKTRAALNIADSQTGVLLKEKAASPQDDKAKLQENEATIDRLVKCLENANEALDAAEESITSLRHGKLAALANAEANIEEREKQIAELEASLTDTCKQLEDLKNRLVSVEEENMRAIDEMKIDLLESQTRNVRLTASLSETTSALHQLEHAFVKLKEKEAESKTNLLECKADNAQLTTSLADTRFSLDNAKQDISELSAALFVGQHELQLNEARIQDLTIALEESSRTGITTRKRVPPSPESITSEMDEAETINSGTKLSVNEKDKQTAELEITLTETRKELVDVKNCQTIATESDKVILSNLEADNEQLKESLAEKRSALQSAEEKITKLSKASVEQKNSQIVALEDDLAKAKTELAEARMELLNRKSRQVAFDEMKEDLLASQAKNDVLTASLSEMKSALKKAGQSIAELKEKEVKAEKILSEHKVKISQLTASLDETKIALEGAKKTISELEGKESAALCAAPQELQLNEARIHDLTKALEETSRAFNSNKEQMSRDMESKTLTLKQTQMRLETSEALVQELEESLTKARASIQYSELKVTMMKNKHTETVQSLRIKLNEKEKEAAELSKALTDLTSALVASRNEIFTIQEESNDNLQRELDMSEEKVAKLQSLLARAQADTKTAQEKIQDLENEKSAAIAEAAEKLAESESANSELRRALESAKIKAQADTKAAQEKIQDLENEKCAAITEAAEKLAERESANSELQRALESAKIKAQADSKATQDLENEMSATIAEAAKKLAEIESSNSELRRALESVKAKAQADSETAHEKIKDLENEKCAAIAEAAEKLAESESANSELRQAVVKVKKTLEEAESTISTLRHEQFAELSETQSRLEMTESENQQLQKTVVELTDALMRAQQKIAFVDSLELEAWQETQFKLEWSEAYVLELKNALANVTMALKDAQQRIISQEAAPSSAIEEAKEMLGRTDVNVLEVKSSLAEVALALAEAHERLNISRTEGVVETDTLSETQRELERSQVQIVELTVALAESTAALEDARDRITELEDSELEMTLSTHQELETNSADVEVLRENLSELSAKLEASQGRIAKLESAEKNIQLTQEELDRSRLEIASLTAALEESISALEIAQQRIIKLEHEKADALLHAEVRFAMSSEAIADLKVSLAEIKAIMEAEDQAQLEDMYEKNRQTESTSIDQVPLDEDVKFNNQEDAQMSIDKSSLNNATLCSLNDSRTNDNTTLLGCESKRDKADLMDIITSLTDATTDLTSVRAKIDATKFMSLKEVQEVLDQRKQKIVELNNFLIQLTAALVKAQERIWVLEGSEDSESENELADSVRTIYNVKEKHKQESRVSIRSNRRRRGHDSSSPTEAQRDLGKLVLDWFIPSSTHDVHYSDSIDVLLHDLEPIVEHNESEDSSKDSLLSCEMQEAKTDDPSSTIEDIFSPPSISVLPQSSIFCQCWDYGYDSGFPAILAQKSDSKDELTGQILGEVFNDVEDKVRNKEQNVANELYMPLIASDTAEPAIEIQFNENFETNEHWKTRERDADFEAGGFSKMASEEQGNKADALQQTDIEGEVKVYQNIDDSSRQGNDTAFAEEREPSNASCSVESSETSREGVAETKTDDSPERYLKLENPFPAQGSKIKLSSEMQQSDPLFNYDCFPSPTNNDGYLSENDIPDGSASAEALGYERSFSSFEFLCHCAGWNDEETGVLKHRCDGWDDKERGEPQDNFYYPIVVDGSSTSEDSGAESCGSETD